MKIFRDLIYVMQGLMKADHKFYKEHGIYGLPTETEETYFADETGGGPYRHSLGAEKMKGQMNQYIIGPYRKVVRDAEKSRASSK